MMTVAEASAVNRVIDQIIGRRVHGESLSGADTDDMLENLGVLADAAHKRLMAGWTAATVRNAWNMRLKKWRV